MNPIKVVYTSPVDNSASVIYDCYSFIYAGDGTVYGVCSKEGEVFKLLPSYNLRPVKDTKLRGQVFALRRNIFPIPLKIFC